VNEIRYRRDLWKALRCETTDDGAVTQFAHGDGVEIGVAEGLFSRDILNWPIKFRQFYMVDRWKCVSSQRGDASMSQEWHDRNYTQASEMARGYPEAKLLQGSSIVVANFVDFESLAFVYVDGDHSFRGVMDDINVWYPKLRRGGVMAFHDYENENYGVRRAVQYFAEKTKLQVHHIPEDKSEDAGAWFRKPL